ncbi:T9SS type A sorting domain-containing protein [Flavobacterium jejuense]|uniref:T9SS type A sorting domain-containing protein n=1 Tax=Flavobacterium jejuense TaxID=1544455 RepID=A0ABX0IQ60_9FLAO|nr:choice-of-anchor tandem repeat GloVer-containing protein [Flavobacterium jejuense]NHN25940.1 T9SS type A sorting domain-containing protein [Flavobacterium jejuense]
MYGTTGTGGINDIGSIFKVKPDGTSFSKLIDFDGNTHGSYPRRSLISDGALLYGMTSSGGENNQGVIFKLSLENLGNTEVNIRQNITIYPNPSNGLIKLETSLLTQLQIQVYNILGEIIKEQSVINQQTVIDLTNYSARVYIIKVYDNDNTKNVMHEKILIK